ncbi:hypothetical protein Trydic_g22683 [Trypoxylus dichotomus]
MPNSCWQILLFTGKYVVFTHVDNSSIMASTLNDVLSFNTVSMESLFITIARAASVSILVNRLITSKLTNLSYSLAVIHLILLMKRLVFVMANCVFLNREAILSKRNLASGTSRAYDWPERGT